MAVPATIVDLNVSEASNSPADSDTVTATTRPSDYMRALGAILRREQAMFTATASATTVDLGAIATGNYGHITGTTTITGFGTVAAGIERTLVFDGALTLTHNATSLILPGGANITTAAGDVAVMVSEGSGNWRCVAYEKAAGYQPLDATLTALASALTAANKIPYATALNMLGELDFKDEDNMASDSATALPSQQSVKAYADNLISAATTATPDTAADYFMFEDATDSTQKKALLSSISCVSGTKVDSTSGTSIDFTSIPSWVKKITISLAAFSTSGSAVPLIKLGDAGGLESSGYAGGVSELSTGAVSANHSSGFLLGPSWAATVVTQGVITLALLDATSFTWGISGVIGRSDAAATTTIGGYKAMTQALDRVSITTTDAFNAGMVNVLYE